MQITMGSFINGLRVGGQGFYDYSTKGLGNKKCDDNGTGVKNCLNLSDVINGRH